MIIDAIIILAASVLYVISQIFALLTFLVPSQIQDGFAYVVGLFGYLSGIINIPALFSAIIALTSFFSVLYIWKVIRWAYAHLPWIGKHHNFERSKSRNQI